MCILWLYYSNILIEGVVKLSEADRDNIDADAMKYMKLCNETLAKFKVDCEFLSA